LWPLLCIYAKAVKPGVYIAYLIPLKEAILQPNVLVLALQIVCQEIKQAYAAVLKMSCFYGGWYGLFIYVTAARILERSIEGEFYMWYYLNMSFSLKPYTFDSTFWFACLFYERYKDRYALSVKWRRWTRRFMHRFIGAWNDKLRLN